MKLPPRLSLSIAMILAAGSLSAQPLVISEIMYHPASTNVLEEWFELFNVGTNTLDLSGWKVSEGVVFSFATNAIVAPRGYLVVAAHGPTFSSLHAGVTNFVAGWTGTLSDDGETIQLEDAQGNRITRFYQIRTP